MGCGSSSAAGAEASPTQQTLADTKALNGSSKNIKNAQLTKINSQLGKKNVVNSFVTDDSEGSKKVAVERDTELANVVEEPEEPTIHNTTSFPAESGVMVNPSLKSVTSSGPSFKMLRGSQAKLLDDIAKSQLSDFNEYKPFLYSDNPTEILKGVSYVREQLSVVNPPVAAIRASGILPRLVVLLGKDSHRALQYEVAWTLTNICSAEHDDCQDVVDQGAVPEFVRLLATTDDAMEVLEQAIWALGNVAADCAELQRYVIDEEVVQPLISCVARHSDKISVLRHAMWLLSNLSRPKPQGDELMAAMPMLISVLSVPDQDMEVSTHACWALGYMSSLEDVLDDLTDAEGSKEVLAQLVTWVQGPQSNLTAPALRILGNMCSGSAANTQAVLDAGALPALLSCLFSTNRVSLKKEIVWSLSNIAAGSCKQVEALLAAGVFPAVVDVLKTSEENLARECAYVLANPWGSTVALTTQVAQQLVDAGLIKELVDLLDASQPSIVLLALEGLTDAVKKGQQMMRDLTKLNPPPPPAPEGEEQPPYTAPINTVAAAIKSNQGMEKLQGLTGQEHDGVSPKANALKNMLAFM